jgi:hypothetical protein
MRGFLDRFEACELVLGELEFELVPPDFAFLLDLAVGGFLPLFLFFP